MGEHRAGLQRASEWRPDRVERLQSNPFLCAAARPTRKTEPTLYARRNLIEQGFQGMQTVC